MEVRKHPIGNKRWEKWKKTLSTFVVIVLACVVWFSFNKAARNQGLLLIPSGCSKHVATAVKLPDGENIAIGYWATEQRGKIFAFRWEAIAEPVPLTRGQESVDVHVWWHQMSAKSQDQDCTLVLQEYGDRSWKVISGSPGNVCYWTNP